MGRNSGVVDNKVDRDNGVIQAYLRYSQYDFDYSIRAEVRGDAIVISAHFPKPLPSELRGRAGFNLEFLPAAYFEKSFAMDDAYSLFPLYPVGPKEQNGKVAPRPLASGNRLVLASDDPKRTVTIVSDDAELSLYDGRNKAQNEWFVVRSLLPADKSGLVLQWSLTANGVEDWLREPVIAHLQVGYHPQQAEIAVIELDRNDKAEDFATLYRVDSQGGLEKNYL